MSRLHSALVFLLVAALAAPARSDETKAASSARADDAAAGAAARAALAGEDRAQGADIPVLNDAASLGDVAGKPIVRIDVIAQGGRWRAAFPVTSVELGEPLSAEAARRAIRELLATGRFARAAVEAYAVEEGAALRIAVLPRRLVATIQLAGGALDRQSTLEAAGVAEDVEVTAPLLPEIAARIRAFYAERGYPTASVRVDAADTDDPARIVLSIAIAPGPARVISQRVFVVDPRVEKEVERLTQRYRFNPGARIDEPSLADADREMAELLRLNGFHRAEVAHRVVHSGPHSYLYVYVAPGPRIVPLFEGNRAFDGDALLAALDLAKNPETKPGDLADRLREFYVRRGFLDVEVSFVERGGLSDPVHHLVFTIREHDQVRVVKRVFPCLTGDLSADDVGKEIESFLEEDLPGAETISAPDPRTVAELFGPTRGVGGRATPVALNPAMTYAPETYDRALKHVRDLYYSKGYLNAVIGPVSVVRATCARRSPPGRCIPEPVPERAAAVCATDTLNLPVAEPPIPESLHCRPDPQRQVACAPEVTLRIPIHPGPQTILYDLAFEGNQGFCAGGPLTDERDQRFCAQGAPFSERWLAQTADLPVGRPLSNLELDAARQRILDAYRNVGYAFAEVRTVIDPSPDRTRARARFVISEQERVNVSAFVVKGATRTDEGLILRRMLLREGAPFRQEQARLSEERIAALGTFSSVSVSLEDAQVPQKDKRVVISVIEQLPQYLDPRIGFSTGEGIRFGVEYGHRNVAGLAIALTLRVQLSYLFDFLLFDGEVSRNYAPLSVADRLERRNTASVVFPEIGLGPLVNLSIDGVDLRDNQRDFGLTRRAFIPTLTYRPRRAITTQLAASAELNDVGIFNQRGCDDTIRLLRVEDGSTIAVSQRLNATWDARDNPFAATRGFLVAAGVEHVNAFPTDTTRTTCQGNGPSDSHLLRLTGRVAGYVRFVKNSSLSLALSLSGSYIQHLSAASRTYPDRLFFLGGVDSLRSYLADSLVPQDLAEEVLSGSRELDGIAVRGGELSLNPRAELRIPLTEIFQLGLFLDAGNVWSNPKAVDPTELRYGLGAGLRVSTPVGPLALDYGFNLLPRSWEGPGAFHFSIGLF